MFSIFDIIPERPTITVLDIGAMTFGFQTESYSALQRAGVCRVVGFEPVESECERLSSTYPMDRFFPYCIGDGTKKNFYLTKHSMTASLYEPDTALLEKFENLEELVRVEKILAMQTHRLDSLDLQILREIDFIKNDTQGAEFEIFSNASSVLQNVLVIQTETEFVRLYKNQPLFADVDRVLRENGFEFHKFINLSGRLRRSFPKQELHKLPESQMLWADAIYVRDLIDLDRLTPVQVLKVAAILHEVYGSYDVSYEALLAYDRHTGSDLATAYRARLLSETAEPICQP